MTSPCSECHRSNSLTLPSLPFLHSFLSSSCYCSKRLGSYLISSFSHPLIPSRLPHSTPSCKSLTYVSFCYCEHISDTGVELLGHIPSLTSLDLSGCNLTDQVREEEGGTREERKGGGSGAKEECARHTHTHTHTHTLSYRVWLVFVTTPSSATSPWQSYWT